MIKQDLKERKRWERNKPTNRDTMKLALAIQMTDSHVNEATLN